jgi:hypothetical protein
VQDRLAAPDPQPGVALLAAHMQGAVRVGRGVLDGEAVRLAQAELGAPVQQVLEERAGRGRVRPGAGLLRRQRRAGKGEGKVQF